MKIVMLSVYDDGKKIQLNPGDVTDKFDDDEAARIISVGGARLQTAAELAAEAEATLKADQLAAEKAAAVAAAKTAK
jgi:hypothetical protein